MEEGLKDIAGGLAWLGFWIGLGLFNFQGLGCQNCSKSNSEIRSEQSK